MMEPCCQTLRPPAAKGERPLSVYGRFTEGSCTPVFVQQQSAKLWELRAAMSLARLWRDQA
jgi:hypothetical protein